MSHIRQGQTPPTGNPATAGPRHRKRDQRPLAVVVAQLGSSEKIASPAPPLTATRIAALKAFHAAVHRAATSSGGYVWQLADDEAVVLFGLPACPPDLLERAYACAHALAHAPASKISVRCALEVAFAVVSHDLPPELAGPIPADARLLLHGPAIGQILTTPRFRAANGGSCPQWPARTRPTDLPLVLRGRRHEQSCLMDAWHQVAAGAAAALHLEGPPLIGKSALVSELAAYARGGGHVAITTFCGGSSAPALQALLDGCSPKGAVSRDFPPPTLAWDTLRRAAQFRPLLLCCEDLHEADAATRRYVAQLATSTPSGTMLLTTARGVDPLVAWRRIVLLPLSDTAIAEVLADRGRTEVIGPSQGNPGCALLLGRDALTPLAIRLAAERDRLGVDVPVAEAVALLGPHATPPLVAALLERSEDDIQSALGELRRLGFCEPVDDGYRATHPLIAAAIATAIPPDAGATLHAAAADLVATNRPERARQSPAWLAARYEAAGRHSDAANWYAIAARSDSALGRADTAAAYWMASATAWRNVEDQGLAGPARRSALIASLDEITAHLGYGAIEAVRLRGDLAKVEPDDAAIRLRCAEADLMHSNIDAAEIAIADITRPAAELGIAARLRATGNLAICRIMKADPAPACRALADTLARAASAPSQPPADAHELARATALLSWAEATNATVDAALAAEADAMRLLRRTDHPYASVEILGLLALAADQRRAPRAAASLAAAAFKLSCRHNYRIWNAISEALALWHSRSTSDNSRHEGFSRSEATLKACGATLMLPLINVLQARTLLAAGHYDAAAEAADACLATATRTGATLYCQAAIDLRRDIKKAARQKPRRRARLPNQQARLA